MNTSEHGEYSAEQVREAHAIVGSYRLVDEPIALMVAAIKANMTGGLRREVIEEQYTQLREYMDKFKPFCRVFPDHWNTLKTHKHSLESYLTQQQTPV